MVHFRDHRLAALPDLAGKVERLDPVAPRTRRRHIGQRVRARVLSRLLRRPITQGNPLATRFSRPQ